MVDPPATAGGTDRGSKCDICVLTPGGIRVRLFDETNSKMFRTILD